MHLPRFTLALVASLLCAAALPAQQQAPPSQPASGRITLNVVVTPKSGPPVAGLQKQDFTVLDNKAAQPIVTFRAVHGAQAPVEVVLVIDDVNADFQVISYERKEIDKFLNANGGHLAHPTTLAIFTDTRTQIQQGFSTDGSALSAALDQATIGLREIRRTAGIFGADDRLQLSISALQSLATKEAARPGRKIILWISPGWPYLSGPGIMLDNKQERQLFSEVAQISTLFSRANITLYSVDPLGAVQDVSMEFYYREFLKGVAKPSQVQIGNLALQVLAIHSGGLALGASNDIAGQIERCMADTAEYYELSYDAPPGEQPDEYHQIDIKLAQPGLTAHTRTGYYWQP